MWSCIKTFATEPLFDGVLGGIFNEFSRRPRTMENESDESVSSFISRRFSPQMADNLVSAVFHGIYAGSIDQLSAKMLFSRLYALEKIYGSIFEGLWSMNWNKEAIMVKEDAELISKLMPTFGQPGSSERQWLDTVRSASVYTFKGGMERLVLRLVDALKASPKVTINTNTAITSLKRQYTEQTTSSENPTGV